MHEITEINPKGSGKNPIYNETFIDKTLEYINLCKDKAYTQIKTQGNKTITYENKLKVKIPTIEGLAVYLGVSKQSVYVWRNKYPEFDEVVEKLLAVQADLLINNGLSGDYNPTISKVLLTKHGYREGMEQTVTTVEVSKEDKERAQKALSEM